jgi:hypothetical protein
MSHGDSHPSLPFRLHPPQTKLLEDPIFRLHEERLYPFVSYLSTSKWNQEFIFFGTGKLDELAKSQRVLFHVLPANAGIQEK